MGFGYQPRKYKLPIVGLITGPILLLSVWFGSISGVLIQDTDTAFAQSEQFIGDTGVTFPSYEANSDGNKVSPIKRSH